MRRNQQDCICDCWGLVPGSRLGSRPGSGGMQHGQRGGCCTFWRGGAALFIFICYCNTYAYLLLPGPTVPHQRERAGRERPPPFCLWRGTRQGGVRQVVLHRVLHPLPTLGGVAPVQFIPAGRLPTATSSGR